jgi:hypothetical protein
MDAATESLEPGPSGLIPARHLSSSTVLWQKIASSGVLSFRAPLLHPSLSVDSVRKSDDLGTGEAFPLIDFIPRLPVQLAPCHIFRVA